MSLWPSWLVSVSCNIRTHGDRKIEAKSWFFFKGVAYIFSRHPACKKHLCPHVSSKCLSACGLAAGHCCRWKQVASGPTAKDQPRAQLPANFSPPPPPKKLPQETWKKNRPHPKQLFSKSTLKLLTTTTCRWTTSAGVAPDHLGQQQKPRAATLASS